MQDLVIKLFEMQTTKHASSSSGPENQLIKTEVYREGLSSTKNDYSAPSIPKVEYNICLWLQHTTTTLIVLLLVRLLSAFRDKLERCTTDFDCTGKRKDW